MQSTTVPSAKNATHFACAKKLVDAGADIERTDRDGFAAALKAQGVPTAIYYGKSMHQQTAYKQYPVADGGLPACENLSQDVISLPMHAYLTEADQERIIAAVRGAIAG